MERCRMLDFDPRNMQRILADVSLGSESGGANDAEN